MRKLLCFLVLCLVSTPSCRERTEKPPASPEKPVTVQRTFAPAPPAKALLQEPITPVLVETPALALPAWRECRSAQPTLVLLAGNPFLQSLPDHLRQEALALVDDAELDELKLRATGLAADPLLLPPMTVRASLEAGFFSRVVWVFPSRSEKGTLNLDVFKRQMLDSGSLTEKESDTLSLRDGAFSLEVAGRPLLAVHPEALPKLEGPIVLHIDLSFFQPFYKGEVKTPLYSLLSKVLGGLQTTGWKTLSVSISFSNLEGGIPLGSRFVGRDLGEVFARPSLLGEDLPLHWQQRANALYLENFFKKEEVRQIYRQMETEKPKDASVKYALYDVARQFKEGDKAMAYLRQAAGLDPIYSLEYLRLADLALEKQLPDRAIMMLEMARAAMPENPFISLDLARTALNSGRPDLAGEVLPQLAGLPWSQVYYPDTENDVKRLLQMAQTVSK